MRNNKAPHLGNAAIDHGQSQPGSLPDLFRREKWLKNAPQDIRRHSRPRIGHRNHHIIAWRHDLIAHLIGTISREVIRLYDQASAPLHRIPRINGQIDNALFQLTAIAFDGPQVAPMHNHQFYRFPQKPTQQIGQFCQHIRDIHDAGTNRLLP